MLNKRALLPVVAMLGIGLSVPTIAHASVAMHRVKVHVKTGYCVNIQDSQDPYLSLDTQLVSQSQQNSWINLTGSGGTGSTIIVRSDHQYSIGIFYNYSSGGCSRKEFGATKLTPPGNDGLTYWWVGDDKFSTSIS
jgi:hypothetical protein